MIRMQLGHQCFQVELLCGNNNKKNPITLRCGPLCCHDTQTMSSIHRVALVDQNLVKVTLCNVPSFK